MSELHGKAWSAVRKLLNRYDNNTDEGIAVADGVASAAVDAVIAAIGDSGRVVVDRAPATLTLEEAQTLREWFDDPSELADKLKRHGLMIVRVSDLEPSSGSATNADTLNPALADWSFSGKP